MSLLLGVIALPVRDCSCIHDRIDRRYAANIRRGRKRVNVGIARHCSAHHGRDGKTKEKSDDLPSNGAHTQQLIALHSPKSHAAEAIAVCAVLCCCRPSRPPRVIV